MALSRREARERVFELLFETEFNRDVAPADIFAVSTANREIEEDAYVRSVYFGVCEHREEIDARIGAHSGTWKVGRISAVSRSILRLCVYEMVYCPDIPVNVSLNEAVELCKKFDDEKARPFVNGVLNSVKNDLQGDNHA